MSTGLPTLAAGGRNSRKRRLRRLGETRHAQAVRLAGVGRQDRRPAGVGHDRHAVPPGTG